MAKGFTVKAAAPKANTPSWDIDAIKERSVSVPIVVRLQGNKSEEGKSILNDSGLNLIGEDSLQEASKKIVELVK